MAADLAQLRDLRERLTKATGPDRQLDVRVQALLEQPGEWAAADIEYACTDPDRISMPKAYTVSMDAALALVEQVFPKSAYQLAWGPHNAREDFGGVCWLFHNDKVGLSDLPKARSFGTLSLAILSALCSALIAEMEALDA